MVPVAQRKEIKPIPAEERKAGIDGVQLIEIEIEHKNFVHKSVPERFKTVMHDGAVEHS